jgi:hypothetical protein
MTKTNKTNKGSSNKYEERKMRGRPLVTIISTEEHLKALKRISKKHHLNRSALVRYLTLYWMAANEGLGLLDPPTIDRQETP